MKMYSNTVTKTVFGMIFCLLVCLTTAFAVSYLYSFAAGYLAADYKFSINEGEPQIGEIIARGGLVDKNGKSFLDFPHKEFILLVTVDPECGASKIAKDQINSVRDGIQNENVEYAVVSFTSRTSPEKFFSYTNSFNLPENTFLWKGSLNPAPNSLLTMVVPSHFLIDSNGKILKIFPGTDKETFIRKKIAEQIIRDVILEIKNHKGN